jgi:hypothetical protein
MYGRFAVVKHRSLRTMLAFSMVLLAGATTSTYGAAASTPVRAERVAATPPLQGVEPIPNGMLPDTNFAVPAVATHVAINGDDVNGDGSAARPYQTLYKGIEKVPVGGTIVMHAGDYPEGSRPGTPTRMTNKRFTLQPAPHEKVWLKGSDVHRNWTSLGSNIWRADGWTSPFCQNCYDPLAIDPANPMAGKPEQVFFNGLPLAQAERRADIRSGKFFYDTATRELLVGDNPSGVVVEISNRWNALYLNPGASGSIIRGIGFANYAPHWRDDQLGALVTDTENLTLDRNAFVRNSATAVGMANRTGNVVTKNVFSYNGARGMNLYRSHRATVTFNRFEANNTEKFRVSGCNHACTVAGFKAASADDLSVVENTFLNNHGAGFWCDLSCTDTEIRKNSVQGSYAVGIFYETGGRANITENWVVGTRSDNGPRSAGIIASGSEDVTIHNNVIVGNIRQIGIHDDGRLPDDYARQVGLSWNSIRTRITNNLFIPDASTVALLNTVATSQIQAPAMFSELGGNTVRDADNQVFHWAISPPPAGPVTYTGLDDFEDGIDREFGTAG